MRVLVTGSRDWQDWDTIREVLQSIDHGETERILIHGEARGADFIAAEIARALGWQVWSYPADWEAHGKGAGPIRNQQMLDEGQPDLVMAFPLPQSRGTWDMVRRAEWAGVKVKVYMINSGTKPDAEDDA